LRLIEKTGVFCVESIQGRMAIKKSGGNWTGRAGPIDKEDC
jgi:hypothetical protein